VTEYPNALTRQNIIFMLGPRHLNIHHAIIFSNDADHVKDRSRAFAFDPNGLLLRAIQSTPERWSGGQGNGRNHNRNGYKIRGSWRSRTAPSMQVCRIDARGGDWEYFLEIDIDFENPDENPIGHAAEVIENKAKRLIGKDGTTDPREIRKRLQESVVSA